MCVGKKKLVFFDFVTHYGGSQRSTALLCNRLKKYYDVEVIDAYGCCQKYIEVLTKSNISVHVLVGNAKDIVIGHENNCLRRMWSAIAQLPTFFRLRRRLVKLMLQIKPDLIWTNSYKALLFLAISLHLRKYPIVEYARGWYGKYQVPWLARWLTKYCADSILAVSNATKKSLESWGVRGDNIHVVFTTIDFDKVLEDGAKTPVTPVQGLNRGFKILVLGTLMRTKGQHTTVNAASILKNKVLDFTMWLVGDVSVGDRSGYSDYLRKLICDNNLGDNVHLLGWRSDALSLMGLSDVIILPSHTEGLPRVVQEAMILGKPVISTPVGGTTDLIIHRETGLLVAVDDEHELAEAIEELMFDKNFSMQLAETARKHIYENFHPDRQTRLVRQAFDREIAKKTMGRGIRNGK